MIETKILGDAVGIQRGDVIDNSETTPLPSLANGVITGHFKRGRMDKPFKVTSDNYKALLGYDPSNPSYLAVEDAFKRGISEVGILRTGGIAGAVGDGGGVDLPVSCTPTDLSFSHYLLSGESPPSFAGGSHGRFRINGGEWVDYENTGGYWSDVLGAFIGAISIVDSRYNGLGKVSPFHFIPNRWAGGYLAGAPNVDRAEFYANIADSMAEVQVPAVTVREIMPATIEFATSSGLGLDIVAVMLGGNKTATACAHAEWFVMPE